MGDLWVGAGDLWEGVLASGGCAWGPQVGAGDLRLGM